MSRTAGLAGVAFACVLTLTACGSNNNTPSAGGTGPTASGSDCPGGSLSGAGSTFQYPIEQKWIADFITQCSGAQINYTGTGSGAGIQQFGSGTIDYAGSDVVMTSSEQTAANSRCSSPAIHIPISAGGVAVTWNLPTVHQLRLSPNTIAGIFDGQITKWNDPAIQHDNPGASLPATPISVFHRSDASGTTAVFTGYLAANASSWKLGSSKTVNWPVGQGAKGNQGVSAGVAQTPGGVTYTEEAFALQHHLPEALVENASGNFVQLTAANVATALSSVTFIGKSINDLAAKIDFKVTGATAYPISTLTYVIVCSHYPSSVSTGTVTLLQHFLAYGVSTGQQVAQQLGFAALPSALLAKDQAAVASIS